VLLLMRLRETPFLVLVTWADLENTVKPVLTTTCE
jgi:hypothetical protein